jgi:hypothetical protein
MLVRTSKNHLQFSGPFIGALNELDERLVSLEKELCELKVVLARCEACLAVEVVPATVLVREPVETVQPVAEPVGEPLDLSKSTVELEKSSEDPVLSEEILDKLERLREEAEQYGGIMEKLTAELAECEDNDDAKSCVSCSTDVAKDEVKKMEASGLVKLGNYSLADTCCKGCVKQTVKTFKNESKKQKRLVELKEKEYRAKNLELLKLEQQETFRKMKNLKKGKPLEYKVEDSSALREQLKKELMKLRDDIDPSSRFVIQMNI